MDPPLVSTHKGGQCGKRESSRQSIEDTSANGDVKDGEILKYKYSGPTSEDNPRIELVGVVQGLGPKNKHIMTLRRDQWGATMKKDMEAMVEKGRRQRCTKDEMLAMRDSWKK